MKTQELKIEAPEGYEIDWENSSMNTIRFKPIKKKIKYHDVAKKLFLNKITYFVNGNGEVCSHLLKGNPSIANNATSEKQLDQLLALNKLMNVAKYLNGDWKPNWNDEFEDKFCIYYSGKLNICTKKYSNFGCVCFKTIDLVHQAIEILGEEEIKKALGIFE